MKPKVITELGSMPSKTLLDEHALAQLLMVTSRTIRRMVGRNELPPPIPFAGRQFWVAGSVLAFIEESARRKAAEADKALRKRRTLLNDP